MGRFFGESVMDLKELEIIAGRELAKHGFVAGRSVWRIRNVDWACASTRTKRIEIAEYYALNSSPETVLDTLLHEIAHAIAGPAAGHGPVWKAVAIRLVQRLVPATIRPRRS